MSEGGRSPRQYVVAGIAAVALVGALISLKPGRNIDSDLETTRLYQDCGAAMAGLTHDALGRGKKVLVLEHDGSGLPAEKRDWMQSQIDGFYAALGSGLAIEKQRIGHEPSAREQQARDRAVDPVHLRRQGFALLAQHPPDVDVIVSFIGEPPLASDGAARWSGLPPVVCFSLDGTDVPALIEAGVVASAIVPRHTPVSIKRAKQMSRFEVIHEIITPKNLSNWTQIE